MSRAKELIRSCLFLVALFAPTAHAETVTVNPGAVGGEAQDFNFSNGDGTLVVDLVWADNKTLEWGAGTHVFLLAGDSGALYVGILLDAAGNVIPGTELAGTAPSSLDPGSLGFIDLDETTVFSGIRLSAAAFSDAGGWAWNWNSGDRPIVGQVAEGSQAPSADAGGPYTGALGVPVSFDGSASVDTEGDIVAYDWDFGDETTGTGATPSHTYTFQANTYWVTLTVTDESGAVDSDSSKATIGSASAPPVADAGGPYEGTAGAVVTFNGTGSIDPDGSIVSYAWAFGDLDVGTGPTPTHTYAAEGKYIVILTVTDDSGEDSQVATVTTIGKGNLPPSADAGAPVTGVVGQAVSFDGGASKDQDGTIAQYDWDYDDGTSDIDGGPTPSHSYDTAGIYTVTLTVIDDGGTSASSFTTADIAENNQPPVADANGPYTAEVGVAVDFDGTGSSDQDGTILAQAWDFGDGNTGVGDTVSHAYAEAGEYNVVLTVIDEDGGIGEDRSTATIGSDNEPPVADADGPYAGVVDAPVSFDGTASDDSEGELATYAWDFDDGTFGSGSEPQHTYLETGVYAVALTVTDKDGGTDVSVTKAFIGDGNIPPVADAGGPYRGRANVAVVFDGSASFDRDGTIATYAWDFGDGINGGSETLEHAYTAAGYYHVTLTVTDNDGVASSDNTLVEIGAASVPPVADSGGPYAATPGATVNFDGTDSDDTDGTIATWAWQFGDGFTGNGATTQHPYSATGAYPVILTVTDASGETDIGLTTALIGDGKLSPVADAGGPYGGAVDAVVGFDGTGSSDPDGEIVSYAWDFGDDTTGSGATTSHTYTSDGIYNVTLTVTDNDGVSASAGTTAIVAFPTAISAASLPSSRSVQVGNLASAFATIVNGSDNMAINCSLAPQTSVAADFVYQTTDASNVPTGRPNTPANIAGGGSKSFVFGFVPTAPIDPTEVLMTYDCANTDPAPVTVGLNTLLLSASNVPVPDIVALVATSTGDGIVDLPGISGSAAFAVATVNLGSTATITASPRTSVPLNGIVTICETNPTTAACLSAPAATTTNSVSGDATHSYSVFVTATGNVPFDAANHRVIVDLKDAAGVVRGSTSVAVRTQ